MLNYLSDTDAESISIDELDKKLNQTQNCDCSYFCVSNR
jgi:hypothetical protein